MVTTVSTSSEQIFNLSSKVRNSEYGRSERTKKFVHFDITCIHWIFLYERSTLEFASPSKMFGLFVFANQLSHKVLLVGLAKIVSSQGTNLDRKTH